MSKRILFVTHHLPWPPRSGGTVREFQILRRLVPRYKIDLVAVSKASEQEEPTGELLSLNSYRVFDDIGRRTGMRRRWSSEARAYIADLCQRAGWYDAVHCEGSYMLHLLPQHLKHRACVVEHNIEWRLARMQVHTHRMLATAVWRYQRVEEAVWREAACVGTLSQEDRADVLAAVPGKPVFLTPNGADHLPVPRARRPVARTALVVANWRYAPNAEGLRWFFSRVWPRVLRVMPDAYVSVVGDADAACLDHLYAQPNVKVMGFVENLLPVYSSAHIVVAPLLRGGGVKVKILEAMRQGVPLVTTPIGIQGLSSREIEQVAVATDEAGFADEMLRMLAAVATPTEARRRLDQARRMTPWDEAARAVEDMWGSVSA